MRVREKRRIALKCESDSPSFDQRSFEIEVDSEDERVWIGTLCRRLDGSEIEVSDRPLKSIYPKFAWKEVPLARP